MPLSPAIVRELRVEARRPMNYWLRVLGAAAIIVVAMIAHGDAFRAATRLGPELFGNLNAGLYFGVILGAPLLTADCLSRERREGTLGLLFLTPLTPTGIVAAKSVVHALRALSLTAAALPVICLAFLFGGAGWKEALLALMLNSAALLLALSAGLLASSIATQAKWANAAAAVLSALFMLIGFAVYEILITLLYTIRFKPNVAIHLEGLWEAYLSMPFVATGADGAWSNITGGMDSARLWAWMLTTFLFALIAAGVFAAVVRSAARRLRAGVDPQMSRVADSAWRSALAVPFMLREELRNASRRQLSRNPIGWLHSRTTGARLTKWLWALGAACGGSYMYHARIGGVVNLSLAMGAGMAFAAAGSFHRERDLGVMELILVSPLSVAQIVWGRMRGLWMQFLPAIVAVAAVKSTYALRYFQFEFTILLYMAGIYLAMAPIGLYFSLAAKNIVTAWIQTIFLALGAPFIVAGLFELAVNLIAYWITGDMNRRPGVMTGVFLICLTGNAVWAYRRLHRNLSERSFVIQ